MSQFVQRVELVVLFVLFTSHGTSHGWAAEWLRDVDQALQVAQTEQRPLVVFVSMDRCKYCQKMIQTTLSNPQIRQALGTHFVAAAIKNGDRPDLVRQLQIRSFPTTLLVNSEGQVVDQITGYVDAEKFHKQLQWLWQQNQSLAQTTQAPAPVETRQAAGGAATGGATVVPARR